MASISILPRPEASATAEPVMPENTSEASTFTWARPPGKRPTRPLHTPNTYSVILPAFITLAAKMNRGTAMMVVLVKMASMVFWATRCSWPSWPVIMPIKLLPSTRPSVRKYMVQAAIMPVGMGIRSTNIRTKQMRNTIRGRLSSITCHLHSRCGTGPGPPGPERPRWPARPRT